MDATEPGGGVVGAGGSRFSFGDLDTFKRRLLRTKTIISQTSVEEDDRARSSSTADDDGHELQKVFSTFDLVSLGIGSCCGTGMYLVAGLVAKEVAGPGVILSFIIAALASILSGLCYGEFGVRVPKTSGSAYMYSYVTVGEFVAFLIGWNLILEYVIGSAAGASALSACFNALGNHSMSAYLEANVGTVIGKTYPDFLGFFIGVMMTVILAAGVKKSVRFNNILNVVNFVVWVFIVIASFFYVDGSNWSTGFAPYGASGIFSGAATCFYAFVGFDIIATAGEETRNPSRSLPIAIVTSLVVCLVGYISVSVILTLMVPYKDIEGDSALIDMFVQNNFIGAKYVVAIGSVAALTVSLLGSMFPMPRVIYAMSRDGLLFEFLSSINKKTNTPLWATLITGLISSFMALLVGLKILVEMMSIGTLLAYTLVSMSVLILRYQPDKHDLEPAIPMAHQLEPIEESPDDPNAYEEDVFADNTGAAQKTGKAKDDECLISNDGGANAKSYGSFNTLLSKSEYIVSKVAMIKRYTHIWRMRLGFPTEESLPNVGTAKTAILFTGLLLFSEGLACLMLVFAIDFIAAGEWWAIMLLIATLMAVVTCFVIILKQPQNKFVNLPHGVGPHSNFPSRRRLRFMAPAVPFLPGCAMFINLYLMLKLPPLTWARLGIWICLGLLVYFSYSMRHSRKEGKGQSDSSEKKPSQDSKIANSDLPDGLTKLPDETTSIPEKTPISNGFIDNLKTSPHPGAPAANGSRPKRPPLPSQESIDRMRIRGSGSSFEEETKGNEPYAQRSSSSNPFRTDAAPKTTPAALEGTMGHELFMGGSKEGYSKRLEDEKDPFVDDDVPVRASQPVNNPYARPRPRPKAKTENQPNVDQLMGDLASGAYGDQRKANPFK